MPGLVFIIEVLEILRFPGSLVHKSYRDGLADVLPCYKVTTVELAALSEQVFTAPIFEVLFNDNH